MMGHNPMMGNLTYLHVAMGSAIHAALELFVWHEDDYYLDGEVLGTNTWEYLGMLSHYSHLGIWSILTITQLLSMFGVLGEINLMAWMYIPVLLMTCFTTPLRQPPLTSPSTSSTTTGCTPRLWLSPRRPRRSTWTRRDTARRSTTTR